MPLNKNIKKTLVIGSGPIIIGQGAEFDYAGTQACKVLKEEGIEVVLINSNPATIMTDSMIADRIYIEPITVETVKRIIEKEKPDSVLSTLGGQNALTLCMQLAKDGFLQEHNVKILGADPVTIDKAEDRQMFKDTMESINQPCIPSLVVTDVDAALEFANEIGYPVIVRPAFTLGGSGGGMASDANELRSTALIGLRTSPIHQVLIEKSVAGWKEIEFEVIRDSKGNSITVCSMENVDPVGIHTGDSIVVAPALTLANKEYQMLRNAAMAIVDALKVEGGCNVQFALDPESFNYAVIEVNPRVSRSSALASKATGYPIAKVAAKIAIGYNLDEIKNAVTKTTYACFEPSVDYVVVKFPKWPFDKFVYAKRRLGTQMKATGEVMAIGQSFEEALLKAVRGAEISHDTMNTTLFHEYTDDELIAKINACDDQRFFAVFEALKRGYTVDEMHYLTLIDEWFLAKLANMISFEREMKSAETLTDEMYLKAKKMGYLDSTIEKISGKKVTTPAVASYKTVDTCAAEFEANTPYFYSAYNTDNEAVEFKQKNIDPDKKTVIVFGSGPIRVGQGIEFDYASVHCVWALKEQGFDVVIMNNNPETVSTDFDTADRLYFEPVTPEDAMHVINTEKPYGVVVQFGGQTSIKLTKALSENGVNILGTSADGIDMAEDRERFDALLEELDIARPAGHTVMTAEEALKAAEELGYPVLMRPSYVLGGQNMIIAYDASDIVEYMSIILANNIENPVLIDKYLMGKEFEVDAICDGEEILIPGIMEHVERAGIHSGDSIAVYPAYSLDQEMIDYMVHCSKQLAVSLGTKGLVNIQYVVYQGKLYVIEVNPRASRTVPYMSKVTGIPMVNLAVKAMLGEKVADMGFGTGLYKSSDYICVKVPVFSFEKLQDLDTMLGPEMKSTGEVLGIAKTREEAIYKGLVGRGCRMDTEGGVLLTVKDADKPEIAALAKKFAKLGFTLYATEGTAAVIRDAGLEVNVVAKIHEGKGTDIETTASLIESGKLSYLLSTSSKGRIPTQDSVIIRRKAIKEV
ncbi:MAG: carbamoyl-phosphate synthase large subunit, partial [Anaerofustis stercorihominis]|nr:carbamoyl-phosphate synthase large subunit [Anaerofustis stercorihominis]